MSIRFGMVCLALGLFAGCEGTQREFIIRSQLPDDGGSPDASGLIGTAGADGDGKGDAAGKLNPSAPGVHPASVAFGPAPLGFAVPARVRLTPESSLPLPAPRLSLSGGQVTAFAVVRDGCAGGLDDGLSCDIDLSFQPHELGEHAAALQIELDGQSPLNVPLSGLGIPVASAILEPAPNSSPEFGPVLLGDRATQTFRLHNPSGAPLDGLSATLNVAAFSVLERAGGDCVPGSSLGPGESCDLRVSFGPDARGPARATLTATLADGSGVSLNLSGRGIIPARLDVSEESLDFGPVVTGTSALLELTLTNVGDGELPSVSLQLGGAGAARFAIAADGCTRPLAPGASCSLSLSFTPAALGPDNAELDIDAAAAGRASVLLSGRGVEAGDLLVTAAEGASADFGAVLLGAAAEQSFRVTNPSDTDTGLLTVTLSGSEFSLLPPSSGDCASGQASLATGASCTVHVRFEPGARGPRNATLSVSSAASGTVGLSLRGEGWAPAALQVAEGTAFGALPLGESVTRHLDLTNEGDQPLGAVLASLVGTHAAEFRIGENDCSAGLTLGQSCGIALIFTPSSEGSRQATLRVQSEPGGAREVSLEGIGLAPGALTLAAAAGGSGSFDGALVLGTGQSETRSFVLTNTGQGASGPINVAPLGNGFQLLTGANGDCVSNVTELAGGQSCTLRAQFTPLVRGSNATTLTVSSQRAGSTSLGLSGIGLAPASLEARPAQLSLSNPVTLGQAASATLIVRNQGDVALGIPSGSLSGPAAADFAIDSSGCALPLEAGAECSIAVAFTPTASGARSATLRLSSNPGGSVDVALSGSGQRPGALALEAAPGSSDFGTLVVGSSRTETFTLRNTGDLPAGTLLSMALGNGFFREPAAAGECNPGATSLAGGQSCPFRVRFQPPAAGQFDVNLSATSQLAGSTSLALRGIGQAAARLQAAQQLSFANTTIVNTASSPLNWVVTNSGGTTTPPLTLTNSNPTEFLITNGCTAALGAGSSCNVAVRFQPTERGNRSATLTLSGGAGVSASVAVTGRAVEDDGGPCSSNLDCANQSCSTMYPDEDDDGFGDGSSPPTRLCGDIPPEFVADNRDCCDRDALSNPDVISGDLVAAMISGADACGSFDRNCNGRVENSFQSNIDRGATSCQDLPLNECSGGVWFGGVVPACGTAGTFGGCGNRRTDGTPNPTCFAPTGGTIVNICL